MDNDKELLQAEKAEVVVEENAADTQTDKKDPSDNLTPDHPRFKKVLHERNELRENLDSIRAELDSVKSDIAQRQQSSGDYSLTDDEKALLDRLVQILRKDYKVITKDELETEQRVSSRAQAIERLESKYDGTNGYPEFDATDVIVFAKQNGYPDNAQGLEAAYKAMHLDAIVSAEKRKPTMSPPSSEKPSGVVREVAPGLTGEKISSMSNDEWRQKRGSILDALRKSLKSSQ